MNLPRLSKTNVSIDMTPMIDIVFQLLTFFMITSTVIKTSAINVDLPNAQTSDVQPTRTAVITVYPDGDLLLNEEEVTVLELGKQIKTMYMEDGDLAVTIQGDEGADYGIIIEVMDVVRLTGVTKMSLATALAETASGDTEE